MTKEEFEKLPLLVPADCVEGTHYAQCDGSDCVSEHRIGRGGADGAAWVANRVRRGLGYERRLISRGPAAKGRLLRRDDPSGTRFVCGDFVSVWEGNGVARQEGAIRWRPSFREDIAPACHVLDRGEMEAPAPAEAKVGDLLTPENARAGMMVRVARDDITLTPYTLTGPRRDTPGCWDAEWTGRTGDHYPAVLRLGGCALPCYIIALPSPPAPMPSGRMAEVVAASTEQFAPGDKVQLFAPHPQWDGIPARTAARRSGPCLYHDAIGCDLCDPLTGMTSEEIRAMVGGGR